MRGHGGASRLTDVRIEKEELVRVLRTEGDNDTADRVADRLADEIDTERDGETLASIGLDETQLMAKLAGCFAGYVAAQARAGADVVQLFDSWVGVLSPADYEEFVAPWSAQILAAVEAPTIHFGTGTSTLLPAMAAAGGDVIGLDWRIALDDGWRLAGEDRAVQGNLDPAVLLGPWERIESAARDVLARAGSRRGHIFNLGHGVLPRTEPGVVTRLAELVRDAAVEARV